MYSHLISKLNVVKLAELSFKFGAEEEKTVKIGYKTYAVEVHSDSVADHWNIIIGEQKVRFFQPKWTAPHFTYGSMETLSEVLPFAKSEMNLKLKEGSKYGNMAQMDSFTIHIYALFTESENIK